LDSNNNNKKNKNKNSNNNNNRICIAQVCRMTSEALEILRKSDVQINPAATIPKNSFRRLVLIWIKSETVES